MDFKEEVVGLEELAENGIRRYENSILSNVPQSLAEKGVLATTLFMYYMDNESRNEWTGKKTYMNVEESYIMSGIYGDEHLRKVYKNEVEVVEVRRKNGDVVEEYVTKYEVIDKREDKRIRAEAIRYWQTNGLASFFGEMAVLKMGGISADDLLRALIIENSLREGENQTFYVSKAIDILGMKVKDKKVEINLRTNGGQQIIESTSQQPGAGFLIPIDEEDL